MRRSLPLLIAVLTLGTLAAGAQSASAAALSKERYRALDRIFTLFIPVSDARGYPPGPVVGKAARGCSALDRKDPVLEAQRDLCLAAVRYVNAGKRLQCATPATCRRQIADVRRATQDMIANTRRANRVFDQRITVAGCRNAIRTARRDVANLETALKAFTMIERGLGSGSQSEIERGRKLANSIDPTSESGKAKRARFRKACG